MKTSTRAKAAAIAEYLATGNVSRSAALGGVNRSTLHRWLQHDDPTVRSAKAAVTDEIYADLIELLKESLAKLRAKLATENLSAPQLTVISGILADKVHRFAPRRVDGQEEGEVVVKIRRGGARAPISTGIVDERGMVVVEAKAEEPSDSRGTLATG